MLLFSAWGFSRPPTFEQRLELQHFFSLSQYFIGDKFRNGQHLIIYFLSLAEGDFFLGVCLDCSFAILQKNLGTQDIALRVEVLPPLMK